MSRSLSEQYSALREEELRAQRARLREAYEALPALPDLDGRIAKARVALGLALAARQDAAPAKAALAALEAERAALLQAGGFPPDHTDLRFRCPLCQDSGFVEGRPCSCMEQARFAAATRQSNLTRMEEENFAAFDLSLFPEEGGQRARMSRVRDYCLAYAESFPDTEALNLLLQGGVGQGKSFLLHCVGGRVLERGFSVRKLTAHQFYQTIVEDIIRARDYGPLRVLEGVDLLILDDIGSEPRVKELSEEYLYTLVDERAMARRHTLFASNLTPGELLARYGERTASRLLDAKSTKAIALRGRDVRGLRRE